VYHRYLIIGALAGLLYCLVPPRSAGAYLPDVPGTTLLYTGTMLIGEKTKVITKTITVLDPFQDEKSGEIWTVHEERLSVVGKDTLKIKYYAFRKDGIYLVAQARNAGSKLRRLKSPQILLKLPPGRGDSWVASFKEKKKKILISYSLDDLAATVEIDGRSYHCLHIRGTGEASVLGVQVPLTVDMWMNETYGLLREVNHRTVRGTETVTTLDFTGSGTYSAD